MSTYKSELSIDLLFNRLDSLARVHGDDLGRVLINLLIFEAQNMCFRQHEPSPTSKIKLIRKVL